MTKSAAVLLADGFEEIEALGTVDILRRAEIPTDTVSMNATGTVVSSRKISVQADKLFEDMDHYDMVILPGGAGAWKNRDDKRVIELLKQYNDQGKLIASICAGPMALGKAGIIKGKRVTSYPGEEIESYLKDAVYVEEPVVTDGNIITSRGPATTFAFAYTLVDLLGGQSEPISDGMLYSLYLKK